MEITAKELKKHTGAVLKRVMQNEEFIITYRGKPIAILKPLRFQEKENLEIMKKRAISCLGKFSSGETCISEDHDDYLEKIYQS